MVKEAAKRVLRMTLGVAVVLLGIVLCFLPGQGLLTIIVGLVILSKDVPALRRLGHRIEARWPRPVGAVRRAEHRVMERVRRWFGREKETAESKEPRSGVVTETAPKREEAR